MKKIKYYCDKCKQEVDEAKLSIFTVDFSSNKQFDPHNSNRYYGETKYDLCDNCLKTVHDSIKSMFPDVKMNNIRTGC